MIPKKIYQIWCSPLRSGIKDKLPRKILKSINQMMKLNSGYQHVLVVDEDMIRFIETNYDKRTLDAFNSLEIGAAKADLFRYLLLYKNGGVYIDISKIIVKPIDEIIGNGDSAIISREGNPGMFVQWCLIYPPQHEILRICIDKCIAKIEEDKRIDVTALTGPIVYSEAICEYLHQPDIYKKSDEILNQRAEETKTKFFGYDYNGYALFRHPHRDVLYKKKITWREEQKIKYGI